MFVITKNEVNKTLQKISPWVAPSRKIGPSLSFSQAAHGQGNTVHKL
jgi:hypothetical protein